MANVQDHGPPSTAAIAVSTAIISGIAGYFLGQARSIGLFGQQSGTRATVGSDESKQADSDISDAASESSDDDVQDLGELKTFLGSTEECKLVLVVRSDLGMGKGMPVSVASSNCYRYHSSTLPW